MEKKLQFDNHSLLFEAVGEAELLLDFISRRGLKFDREMSATIVKSKHLFASGNWQPKDETDFWEAFNAAARRASPVTVASIKAANEPPPNSMTFKIVRSLSGGKFKASATRWYAVQFSLRTFVILISLIAVHIYWSSGVGLLDKLERHKQAIAADWAALSASGMDMKKLKSEGDAEAKKLYWHLRREKAGYDADLLIFKKFWQPEWLKEPQDPTQTELSQKKENDPRSEDYINKLATVGAADMCLQVIQTSILPLLYGLLGAAAYVLRTFSKRIKHMTYVPAANTGFDLRIQLGALAGLAIGWFYRPDSVGSSSLSPLALAFLVGYSVELFFAAMDKFVLAFSGGEASKDPKKMDQQKDTSVEEQP